MATQNVCSFFKFGYCKHGDLCRSFHEKRICNSDKCNVFMCTFRHPIICKYFQKYKRCKFDPCAYKHEDTNDSFEILKKENIAINEKLTKVIRDIEMLSEEEKNSKDIIEKLKLFETNVEKQNEKIQVLENKLKDSDLKIHEQNKEIDILKKELRVLKEKESKVTDLESKVEELVNKVDLFSDNCEISETKTNDSASDVQVKASETNEQISCEKSKDEKIFECDICTYKTKSENGIKIHKAKKHTNTCKCCNRTFTDQVDYSNHIAECYSTYRHYDSPMSPIHRIPPRFPPRFPHGSPPRFPPTYPPRFSRSPMY